jgi:hypothetical protein
MSFVPWFILVPFLLMMTTSGWLETWSMIVIIHNWVNLFSSWSMNGIHWILWTIFGESHRNIDLMLKGKENVNSLHPTFESWLFNRLVRPMFVWRRIYDSLTHCEFSKKTGFLNSLLMFVRRILNWLERFYLHIWHLH